MTKTTEQSVFIIVERNDSTAIRSKKMVQCVQKVEEVAERVAEEPGAGSSSKTKSKNTECGKSGSKKWQNMLKEDRHGNRGR